MTTILYRYRNSYFQMDTMLTSMKFLVINKGRTHYAFKQSYQLAHQNH